MARPIKRKPLKSFLTYDEAMALARHKGIAVRCDDYMTLGWKIMYIKSGRGFFCINPHTGSNHLFVPQLIDTRSAKWRVIA